MNRRFVTLSIISTLVCGVATLAVGGSSYAGHLWRAAHKHSSGSHVKLKPTFRADVAPIIYQNCTNCHRPGQSAPFTFTNYSEIKQRAAMIQTVTQSKLMPPWKPGPADCELANKRSLNEDQIETIKRWVSQGCPEGGSVGLIPASPISKESATHSLSKQG